MADQLNARAKAGPILCLPLALVFLALTATPTLMYRVLPARELCPRYQTLRRERVCTYLHFHRG